METQEAEKTLSKLIEVYNKHKDDQSFINNEKQACQSLIVPLIRDILSWKTEDPSEFKTEVSQYRKRIDYVVCNNGISQFIVEAKAPNKDILDNKEFYQQAISYGFNKERDFAILTNFKHIIILCCSIKVDSPLQAEIFRIDTLNASKDEIKLLLAFEREYWLSAGKDNLIFSKIGNFKKRISVDEQLLEDMKHWREFLLTNIKSHSRTNKYDFDNEQDFMHIEEEVQKFIDRMIFICFCEDKELNEPELKGVLQDKNLRFSSQKNYILEKLRNLFVNYRNIYNSDLFDKSDCDKIYVDDDILYTIIRDLRTPIGRIPYDFKSIEADILGKVYENFIGHIQTGKKRFREKEDIGKRKREGIYYTPKYIVDYIVNNTLREFIKNKSFEEINNVKILDPACGSGSFLLRAFDVLIEESEKKKGQDLTYEEKKQLMLNCIYGVDLDERAVAIAKLNLSLKMAERNKKLPMLGENIRLGNSLIDDKEIVGYKAFVWEEEFKDIMGNGGFDVVVGNPPYVNIYLLSRNVKEIKYYQSNYFSAYKKFDLYVLFIEKAIKLLKNSSVFSFIIPDKFLSQPYGQRLRKFILKNCIISKIVNLTDYKIFEQATVDNIILVLQKENDSRLRDKNNIKVITPSNDPSISKRIEENIFKLSQETFLKDKESLFRIDINPKKILLKEKIERDFVFLRDICYVNWGARSGDIKKFVVKEKDNDLCKPMLDGRDINRYIINYDNKFLIYDEKKLYNSMFKELFENPKIMIRDVNAREGLKATFDDQDYYTEHTLSICMPFYFLKNIRRRGLNIKDTQIDNSKKFNLKYILSILNSKLINFYFKAFIGCGLHVYPDNIRALPIKNIPLEKQQPFVIHVDKMLSLNKRLNEIGDKETEEKKSILREIERTDKEIDEIVYKLYGITEDEKKIIEESLK